MPCSSGSTSCKGSPSHDQPIFYSESAWKQWHSGRVDRLSAPEGWLAGGPRFFTNNPRPNTFVWGADADLSPEGFSDQRLGQFVFDQDGWRFQVADEAHCTFDGQAAKEGLLRTDADGRSTELRVGGEFWF